jgi:hypothetical protein
MLRSAFSKNRVFPDFGSLGAPRSGTTQLSEYIMQHPCVVLPLAKEIGVTSPVLKLMLAQFPTQRQMQANRRKYGTAVTGYCAPVVPSLIFPYLAKAFAPNWKMVIILRDPVERAFSQWRYNHTIMRPLLQDPLYKHVPDFHEWVELELSTFTEGGNVYAENGHAFACIRTGIYLPFLKMMRRFYAPEDFHYVNASEFFADPVSTVKRVYEFLGLPPYEPQIPRTINSSPSGKMDPKTRELLSDFFAPYNEELYNFLGKDLGWQ